MSKTEPCKYRDKTTGLLCENDPYMYFGYCTSHMHLRPPFDCQCQAASGNDSTKRCENARVDGSVYCSTHKVA